MNSMILSLNWLGARATGAVWQMLWKWSLLILFLFALDLALRRWARATVRYALWLVLLAKLVIPPSFAFPTGIAWWLRRQPVPMRHLETAVQVSYGGVLLPRE